MGFGRVLPVGLLHSHRPTCDRLGGSANRGFRWSVGLERAGTLGSLRPPRLSFLNLGVSGQEATEPESGIPASTV